MSFVADRRDARRTTLVVCGDSGCVAPISTRNADGTKAKCQNCGNWVRIEEAEPHTFTTQPGPPALRLVKHRYRMVNLPSAQMAEMREEQPERFA